MRSTKGIVKYEVNTGRRYATAEDYARMMEATSYMDDLPDNFEPPYASATIDNRSLFAHCDKCSSLWVGLGSALLRHRCVGGEVVDVPTMHAMFIHTQPKAEP